MTIGVCVCSVASVVSDSVTLLTVAHQAPLYKDFPGKNTGVSCHALLQGRQYKSPITEVFRVWALDWLVCI